MMKSKKMNYLSLSTLLLVSACASTPPEQLSERNPAGIEDCYYSIASFFQKPRPIFSKIVPKNITESMAKNPLRYPKGFEDMPGKNIQYKVLIDYKVDQLDNLLLNFMPTPSVFPDGKEVWLSLSKEKRKDWILRFANKIFDRRSERLLKISDNPELREALPNSFNYDAHDGAIRYTLELFPEDSAEELIRKIKNIQAHFGVGSMRVMVSNPLNKDLLKKDKVYREELRKELLGYYNFMNELDTLNRLGAGYEKYLKNPTTETIPSFNNFWYGPMTEIRHGSLTNSIDGIVDQNKYYLDQIADTTNDFSSHKFIGGVTFRPDLAYKKERIASEIHGCLYDLKCIEDALIRETYFLMKGKENFHVFSKIDPFDSVEAFKLIPEGVQDMLKSVFPMKYKANPAEYELFRNFAYPLRDWREHIYSLEIPDLKESIKKARLAYVSTLEDIASDLKDGKYTSAEARIKIMGALGEFSKNSGLVDAMKKQYDQLIDPSELKYFDHLKALRD